MQNVKFSAGETILSEGEEGNTAFLIIEGSVEVIVGTGAKAKRVGALDAGDVFGEMSLLEPAPRSATIVALSDTECIVTSYDEFIASMQDNPERAVEFMKTLVRRLRYMNELMASIGPQKRRFYDVIKDWQNSIEEADSDEKSEIKLSEDEKTRYYSRVYLGF